MLEINLEFPHLCRINRFLRSVLPFLIIFFLLSTNFSLANTPKKSDLIEQQEISKNDIQTWRFSISISDLKINEKGEYLTIDLDMANSFLVNPGEPIIPYYSIMKKFPLGTKIVDIEFFYSKPKDIKLNKELEVAAEPIWNRFDSDTLEDSLNSIIVNKNDNYLTDWYSYRVGGGISNEEHVTFLTIQFYPIRLALNKENLLFVERAEFKVNYILPSTKLIKNNGYSLVIISPNSYKKILGNLVDHKNDNGMSTRLVTLDEIYNSDIFPAQGRDNAEKIKYFLKNAVEQWGTKYVLLVGNIYKLPIRKTWMGDDKDCLTDLYYADIYFSDGSFCSWDSNDNNYFGEYLHNDNTDSVDLYPDVYIGRLACGCSFDVKTVVEKIIDYEINTYGSNWYNNILLCGGDTHPYNSMYEGEFMIDLISQNIKDFNPIMLRTSDGSFTPDSLNNEINEGAGLFGYSGHGFTTGIATHPPNSGEWISYDTPYLFDLNNKGKLPVIFFSACLTAKLDLTLGNLLKIPLINCLFPCFAWCMVRKFGGGAIASIGATRTAYSMIDESGPKGGCSYLALRFFKNYQSSGRLGEMLVNAKNDYLNYVWKDPFTIEEFILLGDPTLRMGGLNGF
jgi:hypothetical protein